MNAVCDKENKMCKLSTLWSGIFFLHYIKVKQYVGIKSLYKWVIQFVQSLSWGDFKKLENMTSRPISEPKKGWKRIDYLNKCNLNRRKITFCNVIIPRFFCEWKRKGIKKLSFIISRRCAPCWQIIWRDKKMVFIGIAISDQSGQEHQKSEKT